MLLGKTRHSDFYRIYNPDWEATNKRSSIPINHYQVGQNATEVNRQISCSLSNIYQCWLGNVDLKSFILRYTSQSPFEIFVVLCSTQQKYVTKHLKNLIISHIKENHAFLWTTEPIFSWSKVPPEVLVNLHQIIQTTRGHFKSRTSWGYYQNNNNIQTNSRLLF